MKTIIYYIISILIYVLCLSFFIYKIVDTKKHPEKYEDEALDLQADLLEKRKDFCGFYKSLSHQYSMVNFLFCLIVAAALSLICWFINKVVFINNMNYIALGGQYVSMIPALFIGIGVGFTYIPMLIKTPFFAVSVRDNFNTEYRPKIYQKSCIMCFIMLAVGMPFMILSMDTYLCYDEKQITYSSYFELQANVLEYKAVKEVSMDIIVGEEIDNTGFVYIIKTASQEKQIKFLIGDKHLNDIYVIHKNIQKQSDCYFNKVNITNEEYQLINNRFTYEELEIFNKIYQSFE